MSDENGARLEWRGLSAMLGLALFLICLVLVFAPTPARSQEGHHGQGHDKQHGNFYNGLLRRDTKTSCCDMTDCRPTQSRANGDHYEVLVDGDWLRVPEIAIQRVRAPDGGAHVCAPKQEGRNKGVIFCVVLPSEG